MQQSLEEGLREQDSHTSQLEALLGSRDAALQQLTEQLQAYQGLSPDAAAALQTENAALAAAKRAAEAAAAEADQRAVDAGRRVHQGVATWERLQADLQGENGRLAAVLQRQQHELGALFQEKEVLRARTAMLEARTAAAGLLQPPSPASPCNSTQAADAATQLAAHQAAEAVELRKRLTDAQQRVEEREATARKYRVGGKEVAQQYGCPWQSCFLCGHPSGLWLCSVAGVSLAQPHTCMHSCIFCALYCMVLILLVKEAVRTLKRKVAELETQLQIQIRERGQWEQRAKVVKALAGCCLRSPVSLPSGFAPPPFKYPAQQDILIPCIAVPSGHVGS